MRNINKYECNYKEMFDTVVKKKKKVTINKVVKDRKAILQGVSPTVHKAYEAYEKRKGDLGGLKSIPVSPDENEALLNCYESQCEYFKQINDKILKLNYNGRNDDCPYCNVYAAETVDHYLPQKEYPEFSTFPPNLIPSCSRCNTLKNNGWKTGKKNLRLVLHVYYDRIPEERFLFARVNHFDFSIFGRESIVEKNRECSIMHFYFSNHDAKLDKKSYRLIKRHYKYLKVIERYEECSPQHICSMYDDVEHACDLIEDELTSKDDDFLLTNVRKAMNARLDKSKREFGYYHWSLAVKFGLLDNDNFLLSFKKKLVEIKKLP